MAQKCPVCGADGAYVGLTVVECPAVGCTKYVPPKEVRSDLKLTEVSFDLVKSAYPEGARRFSEYIADEDKCRFFYVINTSPPQVYAFIPMAKRPENSVRELKKDDDWYAIGMHGPVANRVRDEICRIVTK